MVKFNHMAISYPICFHVTNKLENKNFKLSLTFADSLQSCS